MSMRAAQARALQLQALSRRQRSTLAATDHLCSFLISTDQRVSSVSQLLALINLPLDNHPTHMTTGYQFASRVNSEHNMDRTSQQQRQQQMCGKVLRSHNRQAAALTTPSPSSSTSDCCHLDRLQLTVASASTKSAKRKAAEALLAARYSSSVTAAAVTLPAAATATQLQNKRHRSSLSAIIDKLEENFDRAAAVPEKKRSSQAWDASAAAASAVAAAGITQQKPQLAQLQQVLDRLHGQHQQLIQLHPYHPRQVQQQQHRLGVPEQELSAAVAASGAAGMQQQSADTGPQRYVLVPACESSCKHHWSQGWCHTQVQLPHVDWGRVLEADLANMPSFKVAPGYERIALPDGLQVLVVENPTHLQHALQQLRSSMQDNIVAIDLEWRPEFGRLFTPVAMIQLASSRTAVLVRTCRMSYRLPAALKSFLQDRKISLVGFGWGSSDEPKMQSTFGFGYKDFGQFLDLQAVAQGLGYCGFGLARLARHVLGLHMPKSKKISMSNWEAAALSRHQVKYAALDVLVAGQVFRALRLWHSSPSLCEVCHYNLGSTSSSSGGYLCTCGKKFHDIKGYLSHCAVANHEPKWAECSGCGCTRQLPWPTGIAAEQDHASTIGSNSGA